MIQRAMGGYQFTSLLVNRTGQPVVVSALAKRDELALGYSSEIAHGRSHEVLVLHPAESIVKKHAQLRQNTSERHGPALDALPP